ncbi:hypothetical protein Rhe02_07640 [Rhizocola hellebori]|uniref:Uncharacterized protein n=1 Tax=Rhizocola hellebori TaxID=1392758 RepID=A0A8J3VDR3_9ACTN|nr:hypothetical protein Rhe02_07640 [Rhizocola hellebori]
MQPSSAALRITEVSHFYASGEARCALDAMSLEMAQGEPVTAIGLVGSGESPLSALGLDLRAHA